MWTLPAVHPPNLVELHTGKKAFTHSNTSVEQIVYLIATAETEKNVSLLEMGAKAGILSFRVENRVSLKAPKSSLLTHVLYLS